MNKVVPLIPASSLPYQSMNPDELQALIDARRPASALDVLVTPELAGLLLRHNTPGVTNRPVSRAGISLITQPLQLQAWENTGEPIIVSDEGILNDGQHRLMAVVETGIPAIMDLRFGISRHAFVATNSGRKRSAGDVLAIEGVGNPTAVASAARLLVAYEQGLPGAIRLRIPNSMVARAVERWPDLIESVRHTRNLHPPMRSAPVHALGFIASRTANEASVAEFFDVMAYGEGKRNNPPHRLREALMVHRGGHDSGTRVRFLALCIIAWNAWRSKGRTLERLDWKPTQRFPVVEGLKL